MTYETFLVELFFRLEAVRRIERELDRKTAYRFNILDYLRQDEMGLSRVIADLLDPEARHGQGPRFLSTLLRLNGIKDFVKWPDLDSCRIAVATERATGTGRRIDISVEIIDAEDTHYCLAMENKPFAGDQPNQVSDYLKFLKSECKYGNRFLLIYLSPMGEGPSVDSIDMESLRKYRWERHFAIMAYSSSSVNRHDEFEKFRIPCSFADWLRMCRYSCDVDRLRWFLGDAEKFCQQTFGDQTMSNDVGSNAVRDFVLSDRRNLESAFAVYQAWPLVRYDICKKYLQKLCDHIDVAVREDTCLKKFSDGLRIGCTYGGEAQYGSSIFLYRANWVEYCIEGSSAALGESGARTAVAMNNQRSGPSGWGVGVVSPVSRHEMRDDEDRRRRDRLDDALEQRLGSNRSTDHWPWFAFLDERRGDWSSRILELHEECEGSGQRGVTAYFVEEFLSVAKWAVPIIDEMEGHEVLAGA